MGMLARGMVWLAQDPRPGLRRCPKLGITQKCVKPDPTDMVANDTRAK